MKLRTNNRKIKAKNLKFRHNYFSFNFSFITHDKKYNFNKRHFNKRIKTALINKLIILSKAPKTSILLWDKRQGLEKLPENEVHFRINQSFIKDNRYKNCDPYYWIFDIGRKGRIIGKISGNIFYILCVDTTFDTYKH